jgi:hypothetical protein
MWKIHNDHSLNIERGGIPLWYIVGLSDGWKVVALREKNIDHQKFLGKALLPS